MENKNVGFIGKIFEGMIWRSRFIVLLAVVFGLIGAILLFVIASNDILNVVIYTINNFTAHKETFHEDIVSGIIEAIDLYLIAVVLLLFSFGIYELFISEIDEAKKEGENQILTIHTLDQLKDKIAKVIVMVLVVNFFQRVLHTHFNTPLEMLYFALSITALAVGLSFLSKVGK